MLKNVEAILLDLDGTLMPGDEVVKESLVRTTSLVSDKIGIPAGEFAELTWQCAREIFYVPPYNVLHDSTGVGAADALWSDFTGTHPELEHLRPHSRNFTERSWFNALARVGYPSIELADYLSQAYQHTRLILSEPFAGVRDLLGRLAGSYKLAIITNGLEDVQTKKIKAAGIDRYVSLHVISGAVGVGKPDPRIFHYALSQLEVQPERAVMIGDNLERDVLGAMQVGIRSVWISNESSNDPKIQPNHTIASITMLESLLD